MKTEVFKGYAEDSKEDSEEVDYLGLEGSSAHHRTRMKSAARQIAGQTELLAIQEADRLNFDDIAIENTKRGIESMKKWRKEKYKEEVKRLQTMRSGPAA